MTTTYPADATAQRMIHQLLIQSPKPPLASLETNYKIDFIQSYFDSVFPVDSVIEPDAGERAKNQSVRDAFDASYDENDFADDAGSTTFFFSQMLNLIFVGGDCTYTEILTSITMTSIIVDKLLDVNNSLTAQQKYDLGINLTAYLDTNDNDNTSLIGGIDFESVGQAYYNIALNLKDFFLQMIGQMEQILDPIYTSVFTGGCSADNTEPDQPNSPTLVNATYNQVDILIGASICDHGDAIDYYSVERRISGGSFAEIAQHSNLSNLNFSDTNVTPNTDYDYKIRAHNVNGFSPYSTILSVMTLDSPPAGEDPPEDLLDFLDDIVSQISDFLNGIFLGLTELSPDKLFEMKVLEILMASVSDMSITDKTALATNLLASTKEIRAIAESAQAGDI